MNTEPIRKRLQKMKNADDASEFFGELGYAYAGDAPVVTRNWSESAQRYDAKPKYIAQHGDFKVIYCDLLKNQMQRSVQRSIIDQLARDHFFFLLLFHETTDNTWEFVNVAAVQDGNKNRLRRKARRITISDAERIRDRLKTSVEKLSQIDINRQQNLTALEVQSLHNQAFDVEQVTRDFYANYVKIFSEFSADIAKLNPALADDANAEALRLLDRLMFLYFIQKKLWLNQEFDYLRQRFEQHSTMLDSSSYYENVLRHLFSALANREGRSETVGNVPFLNGGLFQFDDKSTMKDLKISNRVFQHAFDELFEKYNFTVEEDMPDDRAVAIDPEMLGKVFESLILNIEQEKDLRKATGSYYTPRSIVSFMCLQSLKGYLLQSWRDSQAGGDAAAYQTALTAFVEDGTPKQLSLDEAKQLRVWLLQVRVIDPAVGSGAFLVGMLQEIIRLVTLLDEYTAEHVIWHANYAYGLKREIIGRCLYGVDIQEQAVQICELRLWLSLVVDYEPVQDNRPVEQWIQEIRPLPNLSYLVRQGNSLIEQVLGKNIQLDSNDYALNQSKNLIDELKELKAKYFDATDPTSKLHFDRAILAKQAALTAQLLEVLRTAKQSEVNKKYPNAIKGLEKTLSRKQESEKDGLQAELSSFVGLISQAESIRKSTETASLDESRISQLRNELGAFIWHVDFGEVFLHPDKKRQGFDIAIANPPYVDSKRVTQQGFKEALQGLYGWSDDLYSHFIFKAFKLTRPNGHIAYITSDTFFTIQTKQRVRDFLHEKELLTIAQCDPFDATVDAALFIARNSDNPNPERTIKFIQGRFAEDEGFSLLTNTGDKKPDYPVFIGSDSPIKAVHHDKMRSYLVPIKTYKEALSGVFFEPSPPNIALYNRFMPVVNQLVDTWWTKVSTSAKFRENFSQIETYATLLKAGDVTLAGIISEGGQGMATGDNGRFLAYLEGTKQATAILKRRKEFLSEWAKNSKINSRYELLSQTKTDFADILDELRTEFSDAVLGLSKGELYRTIATSNTFDVSNLNESERKKIIQDGLAEPCSWLPYRKGDREGNRWVSLDELYIRWDKQSVKTLQASPKARWQGYQFFLTKGVTWSDTANHAPIKARLSPVCVFDVSGMRLTPLWQISDIYFLAFLNSNLAGYFSKKFYNNTQKYQIGDIRLLPIVIPTDEEKRLIEGLTQKAVALQTKILSGDDAEANRSKLSQIEREINIKFEAIYGVADYAPFTEF